ncbi:MAG: AAA family ATPase [Terracidiphilus sp.]
MKQFECFALDTANQCLLRMGAPIDLAPKPFAVLRYLVENPGRLITHDELLDAIWPETYVQPQVLRTYMLEIRKLLGDDPGHPRFIQTLPKRGFRFVAPVTERTGVANRAHQEEALLDGKSSAMVGRDGELALLRSQVHLLDSGQRSVVFVTGEAGIGKTALVDTFCREATRTLKASVARGQCLQGIGGKEEYYPVMEALTQLCAGTDGEEACRILARLAPAWLAPGWSATEWSAQGRELDGSAEPRLAANQKTPGEKTLGDLCAALEALAVERPLILLFEDLHWADGSTLHLISALARRRSAAKLMVLATYCPQPGSSEYPVRMLTQDLKMRRLCVEMALPPLNKNAVGELIGKELGQKTLPQGLVDFVTRRAEGNPLFVIAVVEHLISQQILVRSYAPDKDQWEQSAPWPEIEAGVPDQLSRMIEMEIERLSEDAQRLLEAGSLISVAFPAWAVAAALEKDEIETEEECDALARRLHFVVRAGQDELPNGSTSAFYVFAHGLYREVLYRRQTPARRSRRHIRIAERLGQLFAGREENVAREMATHYEAAGDLERAARALKSAERTHPHAGVC